ncbi:MAG: hypothetical protein VCC00_09545 [Deltaproteobacteria bacterium]
MAGRKRKSKSRRSSAATPPAMPLPRWMPLACLALLLVLALPAWRAPARLVITGGTPPAAEARALTLLAQASARLLSPLAPVPAQPGFPAETTTPADAPGLLAGLLALPAVAAGEPILAWNLTTLLLAWLAALAMLVLVHAATGSPVAAFVAAIAWAIPPDSLAAPLAVLLRVTPLLPMAVLAGARLAARPRRVEVVAAGGTMILIAAAPPALALAAFCVAGLSAGLAGRQDRHAPLRLVLIASLAAMTWILAGHGPSFAPGELPFFYGALPLRSFLPGASSFPGGALLLLALVGAFYRRGAVRPRGGHDPRTHLAVLIVLIVPALSDSLALPDGGTLRLPLGWLRVAAPEAAAMLSGLRLLLPFALVLLAGYGTAALARAMAPGAPRNILLGILVGLLLLENLHPSLTQVSFGRSNPRDALRLTPPAEEALLLRGAAPGALVDLPGGVYDPGAHRLRAAAWHLRATPEGLARPAHAAAALAGLLAAPTESARAEALAALGVGNLLVHKHDFAPDEFAGLLRALARSGGGGGRLRTLGESPAHLLLGLTGQSSTSESLDALESNLPTETRLRLRGPQDLIVFELHAGGSQNFRHPEPEKRTRLTIRFFDAHGHLVSTETARALLPLVVGRGGRAYVALQVNLPETPGHHTATLAPSNDPALTLAIQPVDIQQLD